MTQYTKSQRKLIVKALQRSLRYLWNGDVASGAAPNLHICHALLDAYEATPSLYQGAKMAKKIVAERLWPYSTVTQYMRRKLRVKETLLTRKAVQEFRAAWVHSLIQEFSQ